MGVATSPTPFLLATIAERLQARLPHLLAVYLFGSRATGWATSFSDWDIAVWVEGKLEPLAAWALAEALADVCQGPVDLVDLRSASTVLQYQVITTGQRIWQRDLCVELLEAIVLAEKIALDEARGRLLQDILARGTVHG